MADQIEILASANNGNVPHSLHGLTPILDGWDGGRIPLHLQKKGSGVDVSVYNTLKLALTITSMTNRHGGGGENGNMNAARLHVTLEHLVGGAWQELHRFDPMDSPVTQYAVVSGFGEQVRASWYFARPGDPTATIRDEVAITWGLTADATPDQP